MYLLMFNCQALWKECAFGKRNTTCDRMRIRMISSRLFCVSFFFFFGFVFAGSGEVTLSADASDFVPAVSFFGNRRFGWQQVHQPEQACAGSGTGHALSGGFISRKRFVCRNFFSLFFFQWFLLSLCFFCFRNIFTHAHGSSCAVVESSDYIQGISEKACCLENGRFSEADPCMSRRSGTSGICIIRNHSGCQKSFTWVSQYLPSGIFFAGADFVTAYRAFHSKLSLLYDSSVLFFIIGENPVKNKEVFLSNRQKSDIIPLSNGWQKVEAVRYRKTKESRE